MGSGSGEADGLLQKNIEVVVKVKVNESPNRIYRRGAEDAEG